MHPDLITIPRAGGELVIGAYGFFVGLGLVVGWIWALRLAAADRLPADRLGTAYVFGAAMAVFGARALWIVQQGGDPAQYGGWFALRSGEFATGGGILLAVGISLAVCARHGVPFFAWADAATPAAISALAFERLGAFMAGTNFGVYVDPTFPLAVRFPADSPVYAYQQATMTGMHFDPRYALPVHPVQLYGLTALVLGLGGLLWLRRHRSFSGQVAIAGFAVFVVARMVVEDPFRVEHSPEVWGGIRLGLIVAAVLCGFAVALWLGRAKAAAQAADGLRAWEGGPWSPGRGSEAEPDGKTISRAKTSGKASKSKDAASRKGRGKGRHKHGAKTKG